MKLLVNPADVADVETKYGADVEVIADRFGAVPQGRAFDISKLDDFAISLRAMPILPPVPPLHLYGHSMRMTTYPHDWAHVEPPRDRMYRCAPIPRCPLVSAKANARAQRRLDRLSRHRARKRHAELARRKAGR